MGPGGFWSTSTLEIFSSILFTRYKTLLVFGIYLSHGLITLGVCGLRKLNDDLLSEKGYLAEEKSSIKMTKI